LRVGWGTDLMVYFLGEDFVLVAFHKDIAHRISGEGTFSDVALVLPWMLMYAGVGMTCSLSRSSERPMGSRVMAYTAMALQALGMSTLKIGYRCSIRSSDTSTCWVMVFRRME